MPYKDLMHRLQVVFDRKHPSSLTSTHAFRAQQALVTAPIWTPSARIINLSIQK